MRRSRQNRGLVFTLSIVVTAGATAAAILILYAWTYARAFTRLPCAGGRESLEAFGVDSQPVVFRSREGIPVRGWFAPGNDHPEIVIVVLPGATGNTQYALPDALMLHEAGFSTLIYEHRACADKTSRHSGGFLESLDLLSAVDYLDTRPGLDKIGVLGTSTGGSAAILAAAEEDDIGAVVAMGGFSSLEDDALDPAQTKSLIEILSRRLVLFLIGVQLGITPGLVSPESQVGRIGPRPILLVYGGAEVRQGQTLFGAAGEPRELWIIPGAAHAGYSSADPEGYRERISDFFRTYLAQD